MLPEIICNNTFDGNQGETNLWTDLDTDLYHWTKVLRPVQWFPGHIAEAEKELKEQLKLMDVVIEMDLWLGNRKRGTKVVFSNGQLGMGTMKLGRLAKELASDVNVKRRAKGLLPRLVRAGIVGYPNVGKSSSINRLLKRRMCPAARPGVTRDLRWVRFGKDLELLDSPGILPMRISDQSAAIKLAICDDIGERSYDAADIAGILVQMLTKFPTIHREAGHSLVQWRLFIKQHTVSCQILEKVGLVGLHWKDLLGDFRCLLLEARLDEGEN
ncbi:hypothetical protein TSUD_335300 [Trifolium subterraneum]|uniref:G domain-containing protein n=1 Tax=Trifolium subterraneum TaxID=3900 RepID=A0A2Z6NJ58_TRISU|nr:hypothetical protein TSUD_335300 [Trifolium subterraneum]